MILANPTTFIKLDRNILRWKWYEDKNTLVLFIHFLLKSNYAENKLRNGRVIKRGQYAFSSRKLAEEVGMSMQELRTALKHLESTGEIVVDGLPRFTLITVVNYDKYQNKPEFEKKAKPKAKKKESENQVPEVYREMFGEDYEAYLKWKEQ